MRARVCVAVAMLLLASNSSSYASESQTENTEEWSENSEKPIEQKLGPLNTWLDDSLSERILSGQERVWVTVITSSLGHLDTWQRKVGEVESQAPAGPGEMLVHHDIRSGGVDHRTFWMDASLMPKLHDLQGVIAIIDAQRNPEPYGISIPEHQPNTVRTGEIHGANDAWDLGYSGEGLIVAVADTGVDFAHPDLNGTQARVDYHDSDYSGWPLMFDHNSMYSWMVDGEAYPESNTWYANTSTIDYDDDGDGFLDDSGFDISGVNQSLSGEYHLGEHPDPKLRDAVGGDVPILVVDDSVPGHYVTVWPDTDRDGAFGNENPMRPGEETSGRDQDGDGLWDISAGLLYWVSDGSNGVPYGSTYSARHGYSDRIAGPGNLTLFMLESGSHGTLCASAISAQGVVDDGRVLGMAPNATISSIGNHYSGGHSLDAWRFIAEGYDGDPSTPDQPHIGSFSFGYSSVDDSGSDGYSLYLDWITRVYNSNASYAVAIGNGGHGFGTTKVPGASHGVFSVGAFSSRSSDSWGQSAPWSNRGPNVVGRMDPDIVAVGWSATGDTPLNSEESANDAWRTWGGTSLATPVVAGLLALVEEAWIENLGYHPGSQELRDFVLSTADDRGYEPFIQGGGWMNASRAIRTLEGHNGTWSVSPAQWNTGWFHGAHRDANLNQIKAGENQSFELNFSNPSDSDSNLSLSPVTFQPLEHTVLVWNSTGNGSSGGQNDTWDGHQGDRPDLLIPIHIANNSSYQLPPETVQFRARATIQYEAFDHDQDRSSMERVYLEVFRWTDFDGDGEYHNDSDSDGMVDESEWEDSEELEEVTYWWDHGPQAEVRVGLPFEDSSDGLLLGVWRYEGEPSGIDPVRIEVDWTAFGIVSDQWISAPSDVVVPANSEISTQVTVSVPSDANPGLHQHGIRIRSQDSEDPNKTREWTLPVVTNVPWVGPFSLLPKPLDGNTTNQTLYSESWISGATRWDWRAESGDWRFLTVDWPEHLGGDGAIILDVDWDDNPYTDIDVLWLTETPHEYSEEDPIAYGPSTFFIEERSVNNYAGGGQHDWGTYTGTSRETFVVPATPGTHQMVLHTALHGVETNDNPLNISVGYIAAESSGFRKTVTDWAESEVTDSALVVSTMPLPVESLSAHGWSMPVTLENQTAYQDDPNDKMTSSWWHNFSLADTTELSIEMDSPDSVDLDLFLFRDDDGDGIFSSGEEVERSTGGESDETIDLTEPEDGLYGVAVQGWSVDGESAEFWIDIEIVSGTSLNVSGFESLDESAISSLWPNGSQALGGAIPEGALELNLSFQRPFGEGSWTGFVDIELQGGAKIRLPYQYDLLELDPEISFTSPENLTETNERLPISLHARDIGEGFYIENLSWNWPSNNSSFAAESAWGVSTNGSMVDLTGQWNGLENESSDLLFREVWVNSSLPETEQWFDFHASIIDASGRFSEDYLSVSYDLTAPPLLISGFPWISNSSSIDVSIQTEPGAILTMDGVGLELDDSGRSNQTIILEESTMGLHMNRPFFHSGPGNSFVISSTDGAGNAVSSSFQVVYDPDPPSDVDLVSLVDQAGFSYNENDLGSPVNLTSGTLVFEIPVDSKDWCVFVIYFSWIQTSQCYEGQERPQILNETTGFPISGISDYPLTETVSVPLDITGLGEGEIEIRITIEDWANNSYEDSWPLTFDSIQPEVSWGISPSSANTLDGHIQNISWWSSESVDVSISINQANLSPQNGTNGSHQIALNRTGNHIFCVFAVDETSEQENSNEFHECREMTLPEEDYETAVSGVSEGLVSLDSVDLVLDRHESQQAIWTSLTTGESGIIYPGEGTVIISLPLAEGSNEFLIEMDSLDGTDSYMVSLERDSTPPVLELFERSYRESPLNHWKALYGFCEPGLLVSISTPSQSRDLVCPESGDFTLDFPTPNSPGNYAIKAQSTDLAKNTNSSEIVVVNQGWADWAIEDASQSGPMLAWLSVGGVLATFLLLALTSRVHSIFYRGEK